MYPHHVFDLEPAGTFRMYPICYQRVSGGYLQPEPAMYSRCFYWFPGPLAPSDKRWRKIETGVLLWKHLTDVVDHVDMGCLEVGDWVLGGFWTGRIDIISISCRVDSHGMGNQWGGQWGSYWDQMSFVHRSWDHLPTFPAVAAMTMTPIHEYCWSPSWVDWLNASEGTLVLLWVINTASGVVHVVSRPLHMDYI